MEKIEIQYNEDQFREQLQNCATMLAEKLQTDNLDEASELIHQLIDARNNHIFNSVGRLTRGLHEAINNFNVEADLGKNPPNVKGSEIRDASDRLQYVINMTQDAANNTMDKVESAVPIAVNLGQESATLREEWRKLARREITKDEFKQLYHRMDEFLQNMGTGASELNANLQDILLEQGYQDLTGQVLKRVIGLVYDVERELVNLMRMACQVEEVTGMAKTGVSEEGADTEKNIQGEGPQIHADKRNDVVSSQDDVDDLLSSLGF